MSVEEIAKPRGRRAKLPPEQRKRETFTFRVRTELRNKIEEQANSNGRSLSEEIEYIIENSVQLEAIFTPDFLEKLNNALDLIQKKDSEVKDLKRVISALFVNTTMYVSALKRHAEGYEYVVEKHLKTIDNEEKRQATTEALADIRRAMQELTGDEFEKLKREVEKFATV